MELLHDGIYTMIEIGDLDLSPSVQQFDSFTTIKSLRNLVQLAHVCMKLTAPPMSCAALQEFQFKKRPDMQVEELHSLLSSERDRSVPCVARF